MTEAEFLEFAGFAAYAEQELEERHGCSAMVITEEDICNHYRDDILREYRKVYGE